MSIKRTQAALDKAEESLKLHNSILKERPIIKRTFLIDWYWQQRLRIAEKIGKRKP